MTEFIDLFKDINPAGYRLFFARKPQREAARRLLEAHPLSWWAKFLSGYSLAVQDRFCPKAMSPVQMEQNLSRILIYAQAKKAGNKYTPAIV